jgi:hypothetical protein
VLALILVAPLALIPVDPLAMAIQGLVGIPRPPNTWDHAPNRYQGPCQHRKHWIADHPAITVNLKCEVWVWLYRDNVTWWSIFMCVSEHFFISMVSRNNNSIF